MLFKVNVGGLLKHRDRVLVVRRTRSDAFLPGLWEYPGGGLEPGESLHQALVREFHEECGMTVVPGAIVDVFTFPGENEEPTVEIVYAVATRSIPERPDNSEDGFPPVVLSDEHDAYVWVTVDALGGLDCTPEIRALLQAAFNR